jgi:hypothetical protein
MIPPTVAGNISSGYIGKCAVHAELVHERDADESLARIHFMSVPDISSLWDGEICGVLYASDLIANLAEEILDNLAKEIVRFVGTNFNVALEVNEYLRFGSCGIVDESATFKSALRGY